MNKILGKSDVANRVSAALRALELMSAEIVEKTAVTEREVTGGRQSKIKHGGQVGQYIDYKRANLIFISPLPPIEKLTPSLIAVY